MKDFFKPNKVIIIALIIFFISLVALVVVPQFIGAGGGACFNETSCRPSIIDNITTKILWLIFIPLGFVLNSVGVDIDDGFFAGVVVLFSVLVYLYLISCILSFVVYKIRTRKELISDEKRKSDTIISVLIIVAIIIAVIIDIIYSQKL